MNDGRTHTGIVVNLSGDNVTLNTDLTDPKQRVNVDRKEPTNGRQRARRAGTKRSGVSAGV